MEVKIKYFSENYPRLEKITKGDWIDLRVNSIKHWVGEGISNYDKAIDWYINRVFDVEGEIKYSKGDIIRFGLGVAMELPEGYEAIIAPRSSIFKHYGLILVNSIGVIDNSYCGDNDEWCAEFIAMRDGTIKKFDRVCQFRIQKNQPTFNFVEVKKLGNKDRGGFGSTGKS